MGFSGYSEARASIASAGRDLFPHSIRPHTSGTHIYSPGPTTWNTNPLHGCCVSPHQNANLCHFRNYTHRAWNTTDTQCP